MKSIWVQIPLQHYDIDSYTPGTDHTSVTTPYDDVCIATISVLICDYSFPNSLTKLVFYTISITKLQCYTAPLSHVINSFDSIPSHLPLLRWRSKPSVRRTRVENHWMLLNMFWEESTHIGQLQLHETTWSYTCH